MNLDEILQTFIVESRELLEGMEQALLQLEQAPTDAELINAIFRAAHTIKGSAGLFGLDYLVAFTHHAENVLDRVRDGQQLLSRELLALLLQVRDHIGTLVDHAEQRTVPTATIHARSEVLILALQTASAEKIAVLAPSVPTVPSVPSVPSVPTVPSVPSVALSSHTAPPVLPPTASPTTSGPLAATNDWHIALRCGRDMLRDGMEPLALFNCLGSQGRIVGMVTLTDELPDSAELDPEACYLSFAIRYQSDLGEQAIASVFEFVQDMAQVHIVPPHSPLADYAVLPGPAELAASWADALVACGSLTPQEQATLWPAATPVAPVTPAVAPATALVVPEKPRPAPSSKPSEAAALIRVNADTLDEHINLIGELIIASAGMHLAVAQSGLPQLQEISSVLARLVESVRGSALQLRMVQIAATFNKFQRVVREVSQEIGKDIALDISGAETELDKTVIEKIGDPLTHLVRNAIDHGIEPVAVRVARGKPAQGRVRLHACHDSGSILIEVSDDGGGLSQERILRKAIERGLVRPDQALSEHEIHQLIFEPGFSTAEQVNNLSGRGVGMDVVRRNISALRGSIELHSVEGSGTRIRIRLPLTLAIIDGFLVTVGESSLVIPLDMVEECVELPAQALPKGCEHINLRDDLLPVIRLRPWFGLPELPSLPADFMVGQEPPMRENVVVVRCGTHRAGLIVDALQGEFQTVIRPLGPVFDGLPGMGGFTILGTGRVALIVDVPQLLHTVTTA